MSEKVLGVPVKNLIIHEFTNEFYQEDVVPVVSLEWLEKYCLTNLTIRDCVNRDALILAAKKESEK